MSYSRWSNSVWYTYHSAIRNSKEDQIFEICMVEGNIHFTYRDIVFHIEKGNLLQYVKDEVIFSLSTTPYCTFSIFPKTVDQDSIDQDSMSKVIEHPPLTVEEAEECYTDEEYLELIGYMSQFVEDINSEFDDKTS